ncbi:MAG: hypothetical protein B6D36_00850 [Planctomycetes bacterium UTPLA1]|jgi:hypothetical protein|nr:MAG: hypothetical protein B6D36_00850 [Planctomycetes bacterium UTPLA1]
MIRETIGFDRELRLQWLDAVASRSAARIAVKDVRTWLDKFLSDSVSGDGHSGNRGKTITVLCRIWVTPPKACRALQELGFRLLPEANPEHRLALHWGMTLAAYPFFGDVMDAIGRLLSIQGDVQRGSVIQRMYENWGQRAAVSRATRAAWQTAIWWGALCQENERGRYTPPRKAIRLSKSLESFLVEAALHWARSKPIAVASLKTLRCMFPFDMSHSATAIRDSNRVAVTRQGSDLELVRMRDS